MAPMSALDGPRRQAQALKFAIKSLGAAGKAPSTI